MSSGEAQLWDHADIGEHTYREHSRDDGTLQYIYDTGLREDHGRQDCQRDGPAHQAKKKRNGL